jgi:putative DNA methylase
MTTPVRKKLIEVSIPLEAINTEAQKRKQKAPKGYPTSIHKYWAQRPVSACRAILFAQLVDDPSSWPDRFPDSEAQDVERRRLHKVIEAVIPWEASNDEAILTAARWEIARSVAWGLGEEPPKRDNGLAILEYLQKKAPPVYDPFSGGGSIPLEAQRLGLRAYGSDLNPVAVLIGKALVEIPPKFFGRQPVNPVSRAEAANGQLRRWTGAQGLAEDVRYYGQWMHDEALKLIGDLYPTAQASLGEKAGSVVAWIWARTVRSPDPAAKGAMVPLVSSFVLSNKDGKKAWVEVVRDAAARDGWRFEVRTGSLSKEREQELKRGTKTGRGHFACVLTGAAVSEDWNREQGRGGALGTRLMAIVADFSTGRTYISPSTDHEVIAASADPSWEPQGYLYDKALGFRVPAYGITRWADLFTKRQLVTLTTFSDLVRSARDRVVADAAESIKNGAASGGTADGEIYADAVATYLSIAVDRLVFYGSTLCGWLAKDNAMAQSMPQQALPMSWDFAEGNPFGKSSAAVSTCIKSVAACLDELRSTVSGSIVQANAENIQYEKGTLISTDPPYYDNVGYADLSDFFYVWLRRSAAASWPELFRRILTPKDEELVATAGRHGGREGAERFFMGGLSKALASMGAIESAAQPITIYYAFKQSANSDEGITSAGWSSFLEGVVQAGLMIDGTWPLRTESAGRMRGQGSNALASSIVLVCRTRGADAPVATRADFIRALKLEMPAAIDAIRKAGVGPVDMQQSVIGPGMGVFSRHAKVLEDDDSAMSVKTALAVINRVWEEIENELDQAFDAETQVALAWYVTYGFDARASGELITLTTAKNTSDRALFASGVFKDMKGKAGLTPRDELPPGWSPASDKTLTTWECVQHTARVLNAADGGGEARGGPRPRLSAI